MKAIMRFAAISVGAGVALGMLLCLSISVESGGLGVGREVLLLVMGLLLLVAGIHLGDGVGDDD